MAAAIKIIAKIKSGRNSDTKEILTTVSAKTTLRFGLKATIKISSLKITTTTVTSSTIQAIFNKENFY